ncbi:MAG: ATP phosphoribosyltransferase [Deltaproteobacteria bacterium]|nr:ATP phosphoribosyltransferase [Deltaproteobacteria bacterium]MBW2417005.1 ATP phosphoribosyltransferase [Deltaproteobacteria bacterium]
MDRSTPKLRVGLPKGSLQETTVKLFARAGYNIRIASRNYYPSVDDPEIECILLRPQEMARYVEQGVMDCGITGRDWVIESGGQVEELADLCAPWPNYVPVRWVLAVKEGSAIEKPEDLQGKRIATEVVGLTNRYLAEHGIEAQVEFSWGATEVKPPVLADAIVDVTETGSSLRANNLRVIDTVQESTPRFVANASSLEDPWIRAKMERVVLLLEGAIAAASRVGLAMNVPRQRLDAILALLPALNTPTISTLSDDNWVDVSTVIEEKLVRDLVPQLVEAGARGIIESSLNKIIG